MGNTKKPFPHPGVYVFYPPMHAYVVRVHRGGYWCAIKTISDVWGNGFVGIAPPEYIRDVLCAQAPDPTRPPREPRSARRFCGVDLAVARAETCVMKSFAGTQALV